MKSSTDISHIKVKDKNHLFINCNNDIFRSNTNLPKIDLLFDHNLNNCLNNNVVKNEDKNETKNLKYSSTKEVKTNMFLKTNQKLNPIKNKNARYSIEDQKYKSSLNDKNNDLNSNDFLNTMRKSLFCDNTINTKRKSNANDAIGVFKGYNKKMKSTTIMPQITKLGNIIKDVRDDHDQNKNNSSDNENNENNENNNNETGRKRLCKSKTKLQKNLGGKETKKFYISNKRNQSTNNNKKRTFKSTLDASNLNSYQNNLKGK